MISTVIRITLVTSSSLYNKLENAKLPDLPFKLVLQTFNLISCYCFELVNLCVLSTQTLTYTYTVHIKNLHIQCVSKNRTPINYNSSDSM